MPGDREMTYRAYLECQAMIAGADWMTAAEAVASTAIEHPEWDLDGVRKTWSEWEEEEASGR